MCGGGGGLELTLDYTIDMITSAKKHVGRGVVLNSDGGAKGDGLHDGVVSESAYGKAARKISRESHQVYHVGCDHSAKQYSRFATIEIPDGTPGFENVPRGNVSGKRRIRLTVTTNHAENYNKRLKSHIPKTLTLADYEKDPDVWLLNASWRVRLSGDPLLKFGRFLRGQDDPDADEEDEVPEEGEQGNDTDSNDTE